jgi:hypothetical protein
MRAARSIIAKLFSPAQVLSKLATAPLMPASFHSTVPHFKHLGSWPLCTVCRQLWLKECSTLRSWLLAASTMSQDRGFGKLLRALSAKDAPADRELLGKLQAVR